MNILGISFSSIHESAACLLQDGKLVFACAEERLTRVKQDPRFPKQAIAAALKHGKLTFQDIDHVAFNWPKPIRSRSHELKLLLTGQWPLTAVRIERLILQALGDVRHRGGEIDLRRAFGSSKAKIHFIDHHLAHAYSAYSMAPFDDAAVLVLDGRGASEATTIWQSSPQGLTCVEQYDYPNSIGVFYAAITQALGFQPLSDEWKVMGLAAYGKPNIDLSPMIQVADTSYKVDPSYCFGRSDIDQKKLGLLVGGIRADHEDITQHHKDIASSAQLACEKAMLAMLRRTVELTGRKKICLAGGVALNCKANGELLRSGQIEDLYVQPAAGDDGGAIGAAFAVYQKLGQPPRRASIGHSYLGTEYTDTEIEATLKTFKLPYRKSENVCADTAALLADNALVGWFQGRMEFGPRALGNRSIIANPRDAANLIRVNEAVKFRETWRPFAPSVLHERGHEYFDDYRASPYMILSFWANAKAKRELPAVVHVDGSARVQSVTKDSNHRYHDLISEFGRRTGTYAVLNTSFNLKGDAIVETPAEAIETFYTSGLDYLVMGNIILTKSPKQPSAPSERAALARDAVV